VVGPEDVLLVVLAELVVPLLFAQVEVPAHRQALARPLQLVALVGARDELVAHREPEPLRRAVEHRDAVARS
jgi:hypothetical protein